MATMFVRHRVQDFDAWKAEYDRFEPQRHAMGVTGQGVYQADGDPTDVTVYHHFESVEAARRFAGSDELRAGMQRAGVLGEPDIWFTTKV